MQQLLLLLLLLLFLSFFSSSSLSVSLSPLTILAGSVQSFFLLLFWVLIGLAIVESSFCNLRPLDHTTISFYFSSHSHQLDLSIMVFVDCCLAFFFLHFFRLLFLHFSLSLCILLLPLHSRVFQSTDSSLRDGQLAFLSPIKYLLSTTLF